MRVHLGGHLSWYNPSKRSWLDLQLPQAIRLLDLLQKLGVPPAEVALAVVNGQLVSIEDTRVTNGDRVELYPAIGGGKGD